MSGKKRIRTLSRKAFACFMSVVLVAGLSVPGALAFADDDAQAGQPAQPAHDGLQAATPQGSFLDAQAEGEGPASQPGAEESASQSGAEGFASQPDEQGLSPQPDALELSPQATSYNLWVGGVQVTSDNADSITGGTISAGTASFNPDTNTLTLNGVTITEAYQSADRLYACILSKCENLNIVLEGSNTLDAETSDNANSTVAIAAMAGLRSSNIEFSGSGSLNATGQIMGVYCMGSLTVNGGTIAATGKGAGSSPTGVRCYSLTMNGGALTAKTEWSGAADDKGIWVSRDDATIHGGELNAESSGVAVLVSNELGQSADMVVNGGTVSATVRGTAPGSAGIKADNGAVSLYGGNVTTGGGECGIEGSGVLISNAAVTVSGSSTYGVYSNSDSAGINISGESQVSASVASDSAYSALHCKEASPGIGLYSGITITTPSGGSAKNVTTQGWDIYQSDGTSLAKNVTIAQTSYRLWVGSTEVTDANKDGITGTGITGTVTFDPDTRTLTLGSGAKITSYHEEQYQGRANIYCGGSLIVKGEAELSGTQFAILATGSRSSLTVEGTGDQGIRATGSYAGIKNDGSASDIHLKGEVTATGTSDYGIYASGNITVYDGATVIARSTDVSSSGTAERKGIYASLSGEGTVTVKGGTLSASGYVSGIQAAHISIEGGTVTATGTTYALWARNTASGTATIDISGGTVSATASNGTGIYCPNSSSSILGVLTISGGQVTAGGGGSTGNDPRGVYAGTLNVSSKLTASGVTHGLECGPGGLVVSDGADVTVTQGNTYGETALMASGPLTVSGGSLNVTGYTNAIYSGGVVTISGGTVTANCARDDGLAGVAIDTGSYMNISGGTVTATSNKNNSGYSMGIRAADLQSGSSSVVVSGGTVNATGDNYGIFGAYGVQIANGNAVVAAEAKNEGTSSTSPSAICSEVSSYPIVIGDEMMIETPANGKLSDNGKNVCESDGTTVATRAVIKPGSGERNYAVLSSDRTTLTFKYGVPSSEPAGMATFTRFDTETYYHLGAPWSADRGTITSVVFDDSLVQNLSTGEVSHLAPQSTAFWFDYMRNLTSVVGLANLDASSIGSMQGTFQFCESLASLDLSVLKGSCNPTNMHSMFYGCSALTSLNISGFNTSNVTTMQDLFRDCEKLTTVTYGSNFTTPNVTDMSGMYQNCKKLTDASVTVVSGFNTAKVHDFQNMFENCSSLTSLTFGTSFTTANAALMGWMFKGCSDLTTLNLSSFSSEKLESTPGMFQDCTNLASVTFSSGFTTALVDDFEEMFKGCSSLTALDLSMFNTGNARDDGDYNGGMKDMFAGCESLSLVKLGETFKFKGGGLSDQTKWALLPAASTTSPYVGSWWKDGVPPLFTPAEIQSLTDSDVAGTWTWAQPKFYAEFNSSTGMLTFKAGATIPGAYAWDTAATGASQPWSTIAPNVTSVVFDASFAGARPTSTAKWFDGCASLNAISGIENLNTSETVSMEGMFAGCTGLSALELSGFNTAKVTGMKDMFDGCSLLQTVTLGSAFSFKGAGIVESGDWALLPAPAAVPGATTGKWWKAVGGTQYDSAQMQALSGADVSGTWTWARETWTVTFNASGGVVSPASRAVVKGAMVGSLPTPTRPGYAFQGWYAGSSRVDAAFVPAGDVTLVASWRENITPSRVMHRLYNHWSGEHFYTASDSEKNGLVALGWTYEGVGWNAPVSGADVHRLYNRWTGDHHFTTSASERDQCVAAGWTYEGVGWKSGGTKPVYREYNPYAPAFYHNYTASAQEHAGLIAVGWHDEGIGWYGV